MIRLLLIGLLALPFCAAATQDDGDGFIWIDANTRIKVKPIKAGAGATVPEKPAPRAEKKEKPRK
jgi:hypothetical protein